MNLLSKLYFLTSAQLSSTAAKLGIQSSDPSSIGQTVLPAIEKFMITLSVVAAVGVVCLVAFGIIVSKRQEDRSELMKRIMWVGIGLFIVATATGIVGYIVSLMS